MTVTTLQDVGTANKHTLLVLGDGFTAMDQPLFNAHVDNVIMRAFREGYFNEDGSAWNILRANLISIDSGVTEQIWNEGGSLADPADDVLISQVIRRTALALVANGSWAHDWITFGAYADQNGLHISSVLIEDAIAQHAPHADIVLGVLNSARDGGVRRQNQLLVTMGEPWTTVAHELGHAIGNLGDEYHVVGKGAYPKGLGLEPPQANITRQTNLGDIKWRQFIDSTTPIPTGGPAGYGPAPRPASWDANVDVGAFEGAATYESNIFRPVEACRMNQNNVDFCPVCYTSMKSMYHAATGHRLSRFITGAFLGRGPDVIVLGDRWLSLYRHTGSGLSHVRSLAGSIPGGWTISPDDQFYVGDFDGDGLDELALFNGVGGSLQLALVDINGAGELQVTSTYVGDIRGWGGLAPNDRFVVGDFDGDGRDDLLIYNAEDWNTTYVGVLLSSGSGFTLKHRYDGDIPGWGGLSPHDQFFVGHFEGSKRANLLVFNSVDWATPYLGLFRADAKGGLSAIRVYEGTLPGWGGLAAHDKIMVADINGDGRDDLYIFNGVDWATPYLGLFASDGDSFGAVKVYEKKVPGWGRLGNHDQFITGDFTGAGRSDLFAWNIHDWKAAKVGLLESSGAGLEGDTTDDRVGEWKISALDRFAELGHQLLRVEEDVEREVLHVTRQTLAADL